MADTKEEISKKCPTCKKVIKKQKRYYRTGSYYCNKNCFQKKVDSTSA